ncbi:UNKNOWN [Stylonychia lemnae]|uniref:Uncharacterized protein n=1 Tax=Stylonychia lemnae TaxID=5949 RepID=A0A078AC30_STYLE|nr:UNKNOWN [Stylonychia lemnae]|eukprot:CDW79162.1 UNKNOWN [Stylonychia lemnae]
MFGHEKSKMTSNSKDKVTKKQVLQNFLERNYSSHLLKLQNKNLQDSYNIQSPSRLKDDLDNFNEECVFRPSINQNSNKIAEQVRVSQDRSKEKIFDTLYYESIELQFKKQQQKAIQDKLKDDLLKQEMTFKPKIHEYKNPHLDNQPIKQMQNVQQNYIDQYIKKKKNEIPRVFDLQRQDLLNIENSISRPKTQHQISHSSSSSPIQTNGFVSQNQTLNNISISRNSISQFDKENHQQQKACSTLELVRSITSQLTFDNPNIPRSETSVSSISSKYSQAQKIIQQNRVAPISSSSREFKKYSNSSVGSNPNTNLNSYESDLLEFSPDQFMSETQNVIFEVLPYKTNDHYVVVTSKSCDINSTNNKQPSSQAIQILDSNSDGYQSPAYNDSDEKTPRVHEILNTDSNHKSFQNSSPSDQPLRDPTQLLSSNSFNLSPKQQTPSYTHTPQSQNQNNNYQRTSYQFNSKSLSMIIEDKAEITQSSMFDSNETQSQIVDQSKYSISHTSSSQKLNKFCKDASSIMGSENNNKEDHLNSSVINLYYNLN